MNFRKLITYLTMGTAAAMPLAVAQNPTILQGNYISNVFGNSNFVLNPNALTNVANVAVSNATVTRSTTTPLVATSEFLVTVTSANGTIAWNTRTFDQGMKGQNCEARFTYRGFQSTSVAQVRQGATVAGANVVARLALTPSTDPRIASINFPCGDLSQPTYFVITDTATLSGTHEIGGAYIGLATNMANVAQAEEVGTYYVEGKASCAWSTSSTSWTNYSADADCNTGTVTGAADTSAGKIPGVKFNNLKPGKYQFIVSFSGSKGGSANDSVYYRLGDGTNYSPSSYLYTGSTAAYYMPATTIFTTEYTTVVSPTIQVSAFANSASSTADIINSSTSTNFKITAYRFPSSSELVVTPERQNWYISASHTGANPNLGLVDVTTKTEIIDAGLTLTPDTASQPVATLCSGTNAPPSLSTSATTCAAGSESLGITFNIPSPGAYEVCAQFSSNVVANATAGIDMAFSIEETATNANTALTSNKSNVRFHNATSSTLNTAMPFQQCNNVLFSSIGQKAVRLMYQQSVTTTVVSNIILADNSRSRAVAWTVRPLANQSNSALYVQGPVLGAQTGAAISAGYVGELKQNLATGCGTNSTFTDGASVTITPGIWRVVVNANIDMGTGTLTDWLVFVSPQSGNVSTWRTSFQNDSWMTSDLAPTYRKQPIIAPVQYVRWDGATMYRFENNAWTNSYSTATGTLYAKFYRITSIAPTQCYTSIVAERIN